MTDAGPVINCTSDRHDGNEATEHRTTQNTTEGPKSHTEDGTRGPSNSEDESMDIVSERNGENSEEKAPSSKRSSKPAPGADAPGMLAPALQRQAPSQPLASPAPLFSYSVRYIDDLRNYILDKVLQSYIREKFNDTMYEGDDITRLIRSADWRVGSTANLAQRAGLAPQGAYFGDAVEQMCSVWFDICIVHEMVNILEGTSEFEREKERAWFGEKVIRAYMKEHPADR